MLTVQTVEELIANAKKAEKELFDYTQEEVDAIVRVIAKTVYDNAEELARMAVEETRMGVYADKVLKNKSKSKTIYNHIKNKKSVGIIGKDDSVGLTYVAKPVGVVGASTPTTNPIVTPMCNAMFALKGRNPIIISPHPRSKKSSAYTVALINKALEEQNIKHPEYAIQVIEEPTIQASGELMKSVDVVLATGGMGMVKAAYSSGKPSFGVGAGNVQVIVDREVNINDTVQKIIAGRIFDNGIICSSEQTVICPKENYDEIVRAFQENDAFYIEDEQEIEKLRNTLFVNNIINKDVVGQSVQTIADLAGVAVPEHTKVILLKAKGFGEEDILCKEKMCPVLAILPYDSFEEAVNIAQVNLDVEGRGHSVAIHSNNEAHIDYAGTVLTISRLVVNQPSSTNAGGSLQNGFAPTTTLGCGTWGNNSISENLDYKHLINISRIGKVIEDQTILTDEEIWA